MTLKLTEAPLCRVRKVFWYVPARMGSEKRRERTPRLRSRTALWSTGGFKSAASLSTFRAEVSVIGTSGLPAMSRMVLEETDTNAVAFVVSSMYWSSCLMAARSL